MVLPRGAAVPSKHLSQQLDLSCGLAQVWTTLSSQSDETEERGLRGLSALLCREGSVGVGHQFGAQAREGQN